MTEATLFARARPQVIRLIETYPYRITAGSHTEVEPTGTPSGRIEVVVPYDGRDCFSQQALSDVKQQVKQARGVTRLKARMGYLGLTSYGRTDLDERYHFSLAHNVIPLDIPIRGWGLWKEDDLRRDGHVFRCGWDYTPGFPQKTPLELTPLVYDETVLKEEDYLRDNRRIVKLTDGEVANRVSEFPRFERSLLLEFRLRLSLPVRLGSGGKASRPYIDQLALTWPVPSASRHFHLSLDGQEHPLVYNAEGQQIEWREVKLTPRPGRVAGSDFVRYEAPVMLLRIKQAGELYLYGGPAQPAELKGFIRVIIPRPLSGLQTRFYRATGEGDAAVNVERVSILDCQLSLHLEECFARRPFSPYRRVHFPNVLPETPRLEDIVSWLRRQRFSCDGPVDVSTNEQIQANRRRYLIQATRSEGAGEMILWIVVEGTVMDTLRERELPGRETYATFRPAGDLVIHIRGKVEGNRQRLTDVIEALVAELQARFPHVRTVQ
ncbi:MAG: hypothetical protein AB1791_15470 [Chloroflexota bacterium]